MERIYHGLDINMLTIMPKEQCLNNRVLMWINLKHECRSLLSRQDGHILTRSQK